MKKLIVFLLMYSGSYFLLAQDDAQEGKNSFYSYTTQGNLSIRTNGWGGGFSKGWIRRAYKTDLLNVDFYFLKHEKEVKTYFQDPSARPYFFGKLNAFYVLNIGYGRKKIITEKMRKSGVQVYRTFGVGGTLGMTRPIYLEILYLDPNFNGYSIETERYDPSIHYNQNIYGRASNLLGISELKFHPGLNAKFNLGFEYSGFRDGIRAMEVGMGVEVFPKRIEIMSNSVLETLPEHAVNHWMFLSGHVHFIFGRKHS
ncbi:MAG: hypothetical protein ACKO8Q_03200 [Bacteroidota bacterium]|jgi:hypothetical protein